jgi:membrane-associated phospholipid phosphatase
MPSRCISLIRSRTRWAVRRSAILLVGLVAVFTLTWQISPVGAQARSASDVVIEGTVTVLEDAKALVTAPLQMDRYDALAVGGSLALVGGLFAADRPIRDQVQRNPSNTGHDGAEGVSAFGSPYTMLGLNAGVIGLGLYRESSAGDPYLKTTGLIGLEAEAFAVAITAALKLATGRSAPDQNQGTTHFRPFTGLDGSFVSTHAAASFAVASVFAQRYDAPVGWVAYGLATAVAASRVYTNKHFTSDVVAGSLIGWGMGAFLSRRHASNPGDWRIRPMAMERGLGAGLMLGKEF